MSKLKTNSEGQELCQDCGNVLPPPTLEDKGEGYSESVTYCPNCGSTFTS